MKRLIRSLLIAVIGLCAGFGLLTGTDATVMAQATSTPTPAPNVTPGSATGQSRVVRVRGGSPPNTLRGLSFSSGAVVSFVCLPNGDYYVLGVGDGGNFLTGPNTPAVCPTGDPSPETSTAISPLNEEFEPEILGALVILPLEAYRYPGVWQLISGDMSASLEIVPPEAPFSVIGNTAYLLGGFQPYERIIGVIYNPTGGGSPAEYVGNFELQADADGYTIFEYTEGGILLFIGEFGSAVTQAAGHFTLFPNPEQLPQALYDAFWGSTEVPIDGSTSVDNNNVIVTAPPPPVVSVCSNAGSVTFIRDLFDTSPRIVGDDVSAVQSCLIELGYDPGPVDGYYGPVTAAAVMAFQENNGLVVDGWVGPITWGQLFGSNPVRAY